jgi:MOSC domain-containing protein YiiM
MPPPVITSLALRRIFISDGHSYFGRHGLGSAKQHVVREVAEVDCVAGRGLRGDRFFDYKDNYKGQVTFFSQEIFEELGRALGVPNAEPAALRRNLVVSGGDLNELIGRQFELQGVRLEGMEECKPCYWMDEAIGPGAFEWLKGRGGLRCRILSDGQLRSGSH